MGLQINNLSFWGLSTKDSLTILLSFLTLAVTVFTNVFMQIHWNRRKLAADLKSKSRIEWIQTVRKLTAELLSVYYRILSYNKPKDYRIVQKPDKNRTAMMRALNQEIIPIEHEIKEDNMKELLAIAQEKTQLLMLYYGSETTMDIKDFDINQAKKELGKKTLKRLLFWIDENDGKNKWMSSLLSDTYTLVEDAYDGEDDLNTRLSKAGEEHETIQNTFIESAIEAGLLYNNVTAEAWKSEDVNNRIIDEELLKAKKRLHALDEQKKNLYMRINFIRESTSIYLKHEWDRAKKGK